MSDTLVEEGRKLEAAAKAESDRYRVLGDNPATAEAAIRTWAAWLHEHGTLLLDALEAKREDTNAD